MKDFNKSQMDEMFRQQLTIEELREQFEKVYGDFDLDKRGKSSLYQNSNTQYRFDSYIQCAIVNKILKDDE